MDKVAAMNEARKAVERLTRATAGVVQQVKHDTIGVESLPMQSDASGFHIGLTGTGTRITGQYVKSALVHFAPDSQTTLHVRNDDRKGIEMYFGDAGMPHDFVKNINALAQHIETNKPFRDHMLNMTQITSELRDEHPKNERVTAGFSIRQDNFADGVNDVSAVMKLRVPMGHLSEFNGGRDDPNIRFKRKHSEIWHQNGNTIQGCDFIMVRGLDTAEAIKDAVIRNNSLAAVASKGDAVGAGRY